MTQNTETLDAKLLDLLFHPAFSRSYHEIAIFLMNGVINNEEDPEPGDQNLLNERHDSNVEFNETQVATNTEISERHVTSAEDDGSSGDDVEGDQLQLPFTEIFEMKQIILVVIELNLPEVIVLMVKLIVITVLLITALMKKKIKTSFQASL